MSISQHDTFASLSGDVQSRNSQRLAPQPLERRRETPGDLTDLARRWREAAKTPVGLRERVLGYAAFMAVCYLLAWAALLVKGKKDYVTSDGRFYYAYLSSLLVDGDLDFSNQYRERWGPDQCPPLEQPLTARGLHANKYPIGVALTLAPSFLFAHGVSHAAHAATGSPLVAPDGYSLAYQALNLLWIQGLALLALVWIDRLATERLNLHATTTAVALGTGWIGTSFLYYLVREPVMAHILGFFWVTATLWHAWLVRDALRDGRLPKLRVAALAFCLGMAVVCRPSNLVIGTVLVPIVLTAWRHLAPRHFLMALGLASVGLAPLGLQAAAWQQVYGRPICYSYGEEGFRWLQPALWQSLFSSRHGLFFWSPVLLFALPGLVWLARRREPMITSLVAALFAWWYLNSAWHCWWFGDAFGGRAYVECGAVFILGLAGLFAAARSWSILPRRLLAATVASAIAVNLTLMACYMLSWIPRGDYLF